MKKSIKTATAITSVSAMFLSTACATVKGVGQDVEKAGEKIQKTSDANNG